MRIAANKAYCRVCRTALLIRKSQIPMRTSAKSVPRKKRTAATPNLYAQSQVLRHTQENDLEKPIFIYIMGHIMLFTRNFLKLLRFI